MAAPYVDRAAFFNRHQVLLHFDWTNPNLNPNPKTKPDHSPNFRRNAKLNPDLKPCSVLFTCLVFDVVYVSSWLCFLALSPSIGEVLHVFNSH